MSLERWVVPPSDKEALKVVRTTSSSRFLVSNRHRINATAGNPDLRPIIVLPATFVRYAEGEDRQEAGSLWRRIDPIESRSHNEGIGQEESADTGVVAPRP